MKVHLPPPEKLLFSQTAFEKLMQKRIKKILIICSNYDAFILEQDGRIEEQVFNEYASLQLSSPPSFIHASSTEKAFRILEQEKIDLIIELYSVTGLSPFDTAKQIKERYNHIPIVVLTHFTREISLKLQHEELSAIDQVFCWMGNPDLLVAIIKLLEDSLNIHYDVNEVGVQVILLVEDSVRYTSLYLPLLYKSVLEQSRTFMHEGLNEHQKLMRLRGRPKIILARNYESAVEAYRKYKNNLIGVISDISYKIAPDKRDIITKEGLRFCEEIKKDDWYMPVLLQSSDEENSVKAKELNAGFIHKYSPTLNTEVREYIKKYFSFGDFVFRDPKTLKEIDRAHNLAELQHKITDIPDDVFEQHAARDDFSKWLNARALFPIGNMFRLLQSTDFQSTALAKEFISKSITNYRLQQSRGIIAKYDSRIQDESLIFSKIGNGSLGGKARGIAFIDKLINKYDIDNRFPGLSIKIPNSVVLSTSIFEDFMSSNGLYSFALNTENAEDIYKKFLEYPLNKNVRNALESILENTNTPLAIRSSSQLEDSYHQPFAGVYSTYMIPTRGDKEQILTALENAIKGVYASVYFPSSKSYAQATSNRIEEEKMGVIIQQLCGNIHGDLYYPPISGVARSVNYYPVAPEKTNDGIVTLAYGLGKYIVEGGQTLRFCPKYPKKAMQLTSPSYALKQTQKYFYALPATLKDFKPSLNDENIIKVDIDKLQDNSTFKMLTSVYDLETQSISDNSFAQGKRILTFSSILQYNRIPLYESLNYLLKIGREEFNTDVEIEFAVNFKDNFKDAKLNLLQIRPIINKETNSKTLIDEIKLKKIIVESGKALGNGIIENILYVVYIDSVEFSASNNIKYAGIIEKLNAQLGQNRHSYLLIGPGRWGSSDPNLGIPVKWHQISYARTIIEYALKDKPIEPSQGTHFFHNLTSFGIGYLNINQFNSADKIDFSYLNSQEVVFEESNVKLLKLSPSINIYLDGQTSKGFVVNTP